MKFPLCLSKGWVSNKWLPVSHLHPGIWPSSLSPCFSGDPLSSGDENREMKKLQVKDWKTRKRENNSPHPEEDEEEYGGQ